MGTNDTINHLVQIIRSFMGLKNDQVVVYNQNWKVPADGRLYVSVGLLSTRPFGSTKGYEDSADGKKLLEVICLNSQETFDINIYSYSGEAIAQKDEVVMAFNSTLAQQLMEQFSFKLASLPQSLKDLSDLEGAARLFRFQASVAILRARRKENVVQYYDEYQQPSLIINP